MIRTRVRVPSCNYYLRAAFISPIVRLLFEGGDYSRAAKIYGVYVHSRILIS